MRRKSFFYRLLLNFMLTLFMPMITMLLLYVNAETTIRKQVMVSNQNSLNQFFSAVDTIVEEMYNTCLMMVRNEECKQYVSYLYYQPEKVTYQALRVNDAMEALLQDRYEDVFVYFSYDDRIVSGKNGTTNAWHYYNSYYGNFSVYNSENEGYEDFQKILNCNSSRPYFMTLRKDGQDYLCAVMHQYDHKNEMFNYVAAVVLRPDYLKHLMGNVTMKSDVIFMMFDSKMELFLSGDESITDLRLDDYDARQSEYVTTIENCEYTLLVQESKNLGGYYVIAMPADYVNEQLRYLHLTCSFGIVFSLLLSVLIAWYNSKRSWSPFENLYNKLKKQAALSPDNSMKNELEYIELLFQKEENEKHFLRKNMNEGLALKKEKLLLSLLDGSGRMRDEWEKNGLSFPYPLLCVYSILAENIVEIDSGTLNFVIRNVFEELCAGIGVGYVVTISETKCCLLLNYSEENGEKKVQDLLRDGKLFIEKHYLVYLSIGISGRHEDVSEVSMAYEEAERALAYRYFGQAGEIIQYSDVKDREFQFDSFMECSLSKMIMEHVHDNRKNQDSKAFFGKVMEIYGIGKHISLEMMECFRFELLNAFGRVMTSCQYTQQQKRDRLGKLSEASSLSEFETFVIEILDELSDRQKEKAKQKDICFQAKALIDKNYGDISLSLENLGEKIGCSPAYLSRKYKEQYGISVLEYITEIRIKNAKRFLKETAYSVQEISEMTGYLSSGTFIKIFKKKEGITPGLYRDVNRDMGGKT